jgi:hypothetical protein
MLEAEGYAFGGARQLVLLLAHLSRWLEERGLGAGDLTAEVIETFIAGHRSRHRWCRSARRGHDGDGRRSIASFGALCNAPDRRFGTRSIGVLMGLEAAFCASKVAL